MRTPTLKLATVDDNNKIVVIPTKEGKEILQSKLATTFKEDTYKIAGQDVKCLSRTFPGTIKNFKLDYLPAKNTNSLYVYTSTEQKFSIAFPNYVEVAVEETPAKE